MKNSIKKLQFVNCLENQITYFLDQTLTVLYKIKYTCKKRNKILKLINKIPY